MSPVVLQAMVVTRRLLRDLGVGADVHEGEAAGAVGGLGGAGLEAGLAEEGCLLVAGDAGDGDAFEAFDSCFAEVAGGGHDLGQHGGRDAKQSEQLRVPGALEDVEEHGAGGVGHVGNVAAGELVHEPGIDGAESEATGLGGGAGAFDVVEEPGELGGREVGVDEEAGAGANRGFGALGRELAAVLRRAPVLPDDGVVDGAAGLAVPEQGSLALVCDADGVDISGREAGGG